MKKVWSISTAVRNPERIRDFLRILKILEGNVWNKDNQNYFQILLIQNKLYGLSTQFTSNLSDNQKRILEKENISIDEVIDIIKTKKYVDFDMRGRQSYKPIEKLGFAYLDDNKILHISNIGNSFLDSNYEIDKIFFKSFLKWQLPNYDTNDYTIEDNYNIKPFVATLHLINEVNKIAEVPVGVSKDEFLLFFPTLVNYKDIQKTAEKIIRYRMNKKQLKNEQQKEFVKDYKVKYIADFLKTDDSIKIEKELRNLKDYTDNIIRYFRITKYIYLRGNGYYVDLEPRRKIEIDLLLNNDNASCKLFVNRNEYLQYISNINEPILAWETKEYLTKIANNIISEINHLKTENNIIFDIDTNGNVDYLRKKRTELQQLILHQKSQLLTEVKECRNFLHDINKKDNKALMLEKYITIGLNALNDAIKIKPNYSVGDDNEPINTASGNKPDIECYYYNYNLICEVTMLKDRNQWINEGQPVMRHLRDFESMNNKENSYCLFIAPIIHRDTVNTFWYSVKYDYEGKKQKIVILTIKQFTELLDILIFYKENNKQFKHSILGLLYDKIVKIDNINNSVDWLSHITKTFNEWKGEVLC
jgi:hypothetical protein